MQLHSPWGLDVPLPNQKPFACRLSDLNCEPSATAASYTASDCFPSIDDSKLAAELIKFQPAFLTNKAIYLMVDTRSSDEVSHWPHFVAWWRSRRQLQGPYLETIELVWIQANHQSGLDRVPYVWAGVFALEMARMMYPRTHIALIDNDCVPLSFFEIDELVQLAEQQPQLDEHLGWEPGWPYWNVIFLLKFTTT